MIYFDLFKKVYLILNSKEKLFSLLILILMFVSIILETFGIASFFPLMSAIVNENYFDNSFFKKVGGIFGFESINLHIFFIFFLCFFIMKNLFLIFYNYLLVDYANKISLRISSDLFSLYLNKNLKSRLKTNSAFLVRNINESSALDSILLRVLTLINELLLIIGVVVLLSYINPTATFSILTLVFFSLLIYNFFTKNIIKVFGEKKFYIDGVYTKNLFEGLHAFKEILLFNKKNFFIDKFKRFKKKTLNYQLVFHILAYLPRALIEIILIVSILLLIFFLINSNNSIEEIIPILGIFSAAAFRLFPSALKIFSTLQAFTYVKPVVDNLSTEINANENELDFIKNKNPIKNDFFFKEVIELKNISFNYIEGKTLLNNISLKIKKNESIGIMGKSGSGKSTLLNIITGLLRSTSGNITVDGTDIRTNLEGWRKRIGYIPQEIFLLDASIAENIAFGIPKEKINFEKIENSLKLAELQEYVKNLEKGHNTIVGEKGSKISGGQKQRLGIARAIYNLPDILLLDEATSSLDKITEDKILNTLKNLKKQFTIIMISHHSNPLKIVDNAYELKLNSLNKINEN